MVRPTEDQILKFHEELVSQTVAGLREKHTACVSSFLVELLRHPSFTNIRPEDIELVITNGFEGLSIRTTYGIKIRGRTR